MLKFFSNNHGNKTKNTSQYNIITDVELQATNKDKNTIQYNTIEYNTTQK